MSIPNDRRAKRSPDEEKAERILERAASLTTGWLIEDVDGLDFDGFERGFLWLDKAMIYATYTRVDRALPVQELIELKIFCRVCTESILDSRPSQEEICECPGSPARHSPTCRGCH